MRMVPYCYEIMVFNSVDFLLFYSLITIIYLVVPRRLRMIWILITSILFYISWNPGFLVLICISTITSYLCALGIDYYGVRNNIRVKKGLVALNLIVNLSFLCYFIYANFTLESIDRLCQSLNLGTVDKRLDLLLPVGISFYTFQIS